MRRLIDRVLRVLPSRGRTARRGASAPRSFPGARRLEIDRLEDRRMLALLGIGVNLYEDIGGVPGPAIVDPTVQVGQSFFVEITAQDLRDTPQGVNGLSLDLAWDATGLEVITDPFNPADQASPLITSAFRGFRSGTLDESNAAAMIDELRGVGPSQSGIGAAGPQRFSLIHFRADAVSSAPLSISIGDIGAGMVNYLRNLQPGDFEISQPLITVVNDQPPPDPDPRLTVGDAQIFEGNSGLTQAVVTVRLSEPVTSPVSVRVSTRDDSATAADGDYQGLSGQLVTFQPGGPLTQSVFVPIAGDTQFEPDERFYVDLSNVSGAVIEDGIGEVTIRNDDAPPSLTVADASVVEGDTSDTVALFTVSLSQTPSQTVTVRVTTANGTATSPTDYVAVDQVLTFHAGDSRFKTVGVTIKSNTLVQQDRAFTLLLSEAVGATISDPSALGTIFDNDVATEPQAAYTLLLTDPSGTELPRDGASRYKVEAGDSFVAEVYVTDLRDVNGGGVFAAYADLLANSPQVTWDPSSLTIADGFSNATSGVVTAGQSLVDEAGGTAGTDPTGSGLAHLLFRVTGTVTPSALAGTALTISLDAAEAVQHETLLFGAGDAVLANYETEALIVVSGGIDNPPPRGWQNVADPLDVNGDGLRAPRDVLLIVNELNNYGPHLLAGDGPGPGQFQLDVNGDGGVSRLDALLIFNYLTFGTLPTGLAGEGEASALRGVETPAADLEGPDAPTSIASSSFSSTIDHTLINAPPRDEIALQANSQTVAPLDMAIDHVQSTATPVRYAADDSLIEPTRASAGAISGQEPLSDEFFRLLGE